MYCPRCGAENEEGSRYCVSCGSALPRKSAARGPAEANAHADSGGFGATLGRIVGTTRKARLVSAGIAVALVVAVVAFIVLGSNHESSIPQDGPTKAMDANCVHHKVELAKAQAQAINGGDLAAVSLYADTVVQVAGNWRIQLARFGAHPDRAEQVEALRAALLEVEIEAGALARSARERNKAELVAAASRVDIATRNVEAAIAELELEQCSQLVFSTGRLIRE